MFQTRVIYYVIGGILVLAIIAGIIFFISPSTQPVVSQETPEQKTVTFSVFFSQKNVSATDCSQVLPVKRTIPYTTGVATEALQQLFLGPTPQELQQGYTGALIASSSPLIRISIDSGTAYVDLEDIRKTHGNLSTSCGAGAFFSQVTNTLTQFSSIQRVIFAIRENPQTFYDWMQIGCSLENEYCNPAYFLMAGKNSSSWTTYTDPQKLYAISYPSLFSKTERPRLFDPVITKETESVSFTHRIPIKFCGMSGECSPSTIDLQIQLSVLNSPLSEVTRAIASSTTQEPQPFTVGEKTGVVASMGVEGEGIYEYAIPLSVTQTLFITRTYIDEASNITYKTAPLFIPFEDQRELFNTILSTLKIL